MTRRQNNPPSTDEIKAEYFRWLCGLVGIATPGHNYWSLAVQMHAKEFIWTVPNDDNRDEDGKKLRSEFLDDTDFRCPSCNLGIRYGCHACLDGPCSILEMLIALAFRMEYILSDPSKGDVTSDYFWEFVKNLGLERFTDEDYSDRLGLTTVNRILDKLVERDYKANGEGGIFPLKRVTKDHRKVEIWYQMMAYITENYTY